MSTEQRLDRIEQTLDKLSTAISDMARIDERLLHVFKSLERHEKRLDEQEDEVRELENVVMSNSSSVKNSERFFWIVVSASISLAVYMMRQSMWQTLLSPIVTLLGQVLKNRSEEKNAVHKAKMEVIKNTASWEQLMATASATSWKDEWFTLLLSAPVVAVVWGIGMNDVDILDRIGLAFEELNRLPDWYQYLLFMAVSASFGIRGADKLLALKGKK